MKLAAAPKILIVDDDLAVRESMSMILRSGGFEVSTAEDGFDALLQLRTEVPDVVISDLNMPKMSGFEFLSIVRRRFPQIGVLAMSGAYMSGNDVPGGVISDAFHTKGRSRPDELAATVKWLLQNVAERTISHQRQSAPVWIPRNGKDAKGVPFIVLTCSDCLRSFHVAVINERIQEIQETPCLFCASPVRYIIDFSVDVFSPNKPPINPVAL